MAVYTQTFGVYNNTLQLTLTETVNASNNTSTISYDVRVLGSGYDVQNNNYLVLTFNGNTLYNANPGRVVDNGVITSGSFTFTHNTDGTGSFSVYCKYDTILSSSGEVSATISDTFTCTTISRGSSFSVGNGTLGTAQTITITKASSSYTHTLTYKAGNTSGTIATKTSATSVSWTPTVSLASQNTIGTTISCTVTLTTYSGNTAVGTSSKTITLTIPATIKPTSGTTTISDTGTIKFSGKWVKDYSQFHIVWQVSTANDYGATLDSGTLTIGGTNYGVTVSRNGTTATLTGNVLLRTAGNLTWTMTAKDSRGRTVSTTGTITVYAYSSPGLSAVSVERCDSTGTVSSSGTYALVKATVSYSSVGGSNSFTGKISYSGTSTTFTATTISQVVGGSFSTDNSYTITISVTDTAGSSASVSLQLPSQFVLIDWHSSGTGMAIGKVSDTANLLDIALPTKFNSTIQRTKPTYAITHSASNGGTAGFICLVEITITGYYASGTMEFYFLQRAGNGKVILEFANNASSKLVNQSFFITEGWLAGARLSRSQVGDAYVYDLYIQKSEAYDDISLMEIRVPDYMKSKVNIELVNLFTNSTSGWIATAPKYRPTLVNS